MNCALSIFLVLIFTFQLAQSQVTESLTEKSEQEMYDFYILKHKKLKKTGWILLGAGLAVAGGGYAIAANSNVLDSGGGFVPGSLLLIAGSLSTVASIPVFVVSGSNNRKAKEILGSGKIGIGGIPFDNQRYVSVGLRIDF